MNNQKKIILPIVLLFIFLNTFLLTAKSIFIKYSIDRDVVMVANIICFLLHLGTLFLQKQSLKSSNPNAFVRAAMAGILMKLLICMFAVAVYVMTAKQVNKPAIYISLFLYLVYMFIELAAILKLNKQKNG
ncbi:MAG: hypothetical protein KA319_10015 [Ferruginibacter sp.]|nr:hypothetical protein [Ferruginibacter sp.]